MADPDYIPYSCPLLDEADRAAVSASLAGAMISQGPILGRFEQAFARRVEAAWGVAFSSGTAAVHGMVAAAGIGAGDEVIVPALTFAGTANAVRYVGAVPVFADVNPDTLCLDPEAVVRLITDRTRAILTVDFAGHPSAYPELREIASANGLLVLSDAAHAPGATLDGTPVGSPKLGDMTAFSFNPIKNMTCGEGGMVTGADMSREQMLRKFRVHGMTRETAQLESAAPASWYYEQQFLGFNYKLSEPHAALGLSQLDKLDRYNGLRRQQAARYPLLLAGLQLDTPHVASGAVSAWHLYPVRLQDAARRDGVFEYLRSHGIGVQLHYAPVAAHPDYRRLGYDPADTPVALDYARRAMSLPLHPALTRGQQERVASVLSLALESVQAAAG